MDSKKSSETYMPIEPESLISPTKKVLKLAKGFALSVTIYSLFTCMTAGMTGGFLKIGISLENELLLKKETSLLLKSMNYPLYALSFPGIKIGSYLYKK